MSPWSLLCREFGPDLLLCTIMYNYVQWWRIKITFYRVTRSCVLLFSSQQCEAIMPGRGKTSPWWTHFQQVEGRVEIILLFLIWIVQVTFDLQSACIVTRWCEEGKLAAVLGRRPIQAWLHTWGLGMVVLLSRWCSLLIFVHCFSGAEAGRGW